MAKHAVVGAEVMAPLGNAVGFIDGDEAWLALSQHVDKAGDAEAFGGDEEEVEGAVEVAAAGFARGLAWKAGVDAGDVEPERGKLGGLVVHQSDERGDDQRGASASKGGQLIAERFAGTCRHDQKHIAAIDGGAANGLLVGAKRVEAEALLQYGI